MADIKINVQVIEGQAKAAVAGLAKQTKEADNAFKALNISIKQVTGATQVFLGNLATKAVSTLTSQVEAFFHAVGETAVEVDNLKAKLQTITGSLSSAEAAFKAIQKVSDESPFELPEVGQAAEKLLALGVEVKDLEGVLRNLGDISTASGASLTELSIAFGKVEASGRLTGRELSAFQNNAIPIVDALAQVMGKTTIQVKELANRGKIDAETFQKALKSLGEEGGFAFNAMSRQSQTLQGRIKSVKDAFEEIRISMAEKLTPAFKAVFTAIAQLVKNFGGFIESSNTVRTAGQFVVDAFVAVVKAATFVYNAVQGLRLVVTAVGAAFVDLAANVLNGVSVIIDGWSKVARILHLPIADELEAAKTSIENFSMALKGTSDDMDQAVTDIGTNMAFASQQADDFASNVQSAFNTEVHLAEQSASAVESSTGRKKAANEGLTQAELDEQRKRLEAQIKNDDAILGEKQRLDAALLEQVLIADGELSAQDELELLRQADVLAREREQQQIADATRLGDKNALALAESKIAADQATRDLAIQKKTNELKKKSDEDSVRNRKDTLSTIATLQNENNSTLATIGKAAALTQIAIDTPVAVGKALAAFPPPFNFIAAAAVGAAMAAQAAKVVGVKFADGGIVPGNSFSGDKVSAQLNSGEMVLNKGQQAQLFDMANNGGAGGQVIQINNVVELDGEVVARSVSRQVANGLKLGEVV
jgi:tape measure domain-containing protein